MEQVQAYFWCRQVGNYTLKFILPENGAEIDLQVHLKCLWKPIMLGAKRALQTDMPCNEQIRKAVQSGQ